MASKFRDIIDNLDTVLAAVTGVSVVYRVGNISPSIVALAAGTAFPVIFLSALSRSPGEQHMGSTRPGYSTFEVAVLMVDNARTESDPDWSANRAMEMEVLVDAAVLAAPKRGGAAADTKWVGTTYNPAEFTQVDSAVGMKYEIKTRTQYGDLTSSG